MKDKKVDTKPKKSPLDGFKLWAEKDSYPKKYVSPTAGKRKPWYIRALNATLYVVVGFVLEVILAVKYIIRKVM